MADAFEDLPFNCGRECRIAYTASTLTIERATRKDGSPPSRAPVTAVIEANHTLFTTRSIPAQRFTP